MFEKASRIKLRFETPIGLIEPENLWDLPLTSNSGQLCLDDIARWLHKDLQDTSPVSFVDKNDVIGNDLIQLRFDIAKHVIDVLLNERAERAKARDNAEKKNRLLSLMADKENEDFKVLSREELKKMIAAL